MGLLANIKRDAQKSGEGKGKIFYVKSGNKKRIRFLQDMEEGIEVPWHKDWDKNVNHPCQEFLGNGRCPYCEDGNEPRNQYAWSIWDYDSSEVKLFMFAVNRCSPLDSVAAAYDNYGTIKDRDYSISVSGSNTDKRYAVMALDRSKFRNDKAKPFTKQAIIKLLKEAFPCDIAPSGSGSKKKDKNEEDLWSGSMNEPEDDYNSMTPKQLFDLCKDRGIDAKPKKDTLYYIDLLEADDAKDEEEAEDWGDEEENEAPDYSSMSPKELYDLCQDRNIEAEKKKPKQFYITLLEEYDNANDDWGDNDEEEWESE